ncbi:MAG: transglutaminase family protein [Planctomycetota bacterium]
MPYFRIRHLTRYEFEAPVREAVMEARLQPRDDQGQSVVAFDLSISPRVPVSSYRDWAGNTVHHFDIPRTHTHQEVAAESVVRVDWSARQQDFPQALPEDTWQHYAQLRAMPENIDMVLASTFAHRSDRLADLTQTLEVGRAKDPLSTVWHASHAIYMHFAYKPESTQVDSPIDDAIESRSGVCQDFAHILIALLRGLGIPARYVSGYLVPESEEQDQKKDPGSVDGGAGAQPAEASHAWVEAMLPTLGWVGIDPTHDRWAFDGYIRTAIGRDYADVPPVRGVYRGSAESELTVAVEVTLLDGPPSTASAPPTSGWTPPEPVEDYVEDTDPLPFEYAAQQMQQQQR